MTACHVELVQQGKTLCSKAGKRNSLSAESQAQGPFPNTIYLKASFLCLHKVLPELVFGRKMSSLKRRPFPGSQNRRSACEHLILQPGDASPIRVALY